MNSSSSSSPSSKVNKTYSKATANLVTINQKVNVTKDQHEVLNIICNTYQISISDSHLTFYQCQSLVPPTHCTCLTFDISYHMSHQMTNVLH